MAVRFRSLSLSAILLLGCAEAPRPAAPPAPALPKLEGFWASEGYGSQIEVTSGGDLVRSQVTSVSCLPSWKAAVVARDPSATTYRRSDRPATLRISPTASPDRIRYRSGGAASDVFYRRLPRALAVCDHPTPDTPRSNFDVFAATFADNYPFFADRKVDWARLVEARRAGVTDATTPRALFDLFHDMLAPLEDAHTSIHAPKLEGGFEWNGMRMPEGTLTEDADFERASRLVDRYLVGPLQRHCLGKVESGMLPGDIAYLRIRELVGYDAGNTFEGGLAALEQALDTIFAGASRWRGLVVDVRINGGGYDAYGTAVAARLTRVEYLAYDKQARSDPHDPTKWTEPQPTVVAPRAPGFHGAVVALTGPNSISAAETFTMALLSRAPPVERVGQSTQGVFSDVMERLLPNGWTIGVPNERYLTRGKSYDGTGVPPTIPVPLYKAADIEEGRDTALEAALRVLAGERAADVRSAAPVAP